MSRQVSVDPKVYELAQHFLSDVPPELKDETKTVEFAQWIQSMVEMYMESEGW